MPETAEEALAALRDVLNEAKGRTGLARKELKARTETAGNPVGLTTISQALNPGNPVPTWRTVAALAGALRIDAAGLDHLRELWSRAEGRRPGQAAAPDPTATVAESGPRLLEVHPALLPRGAAADDPPRIPFLTPYLRRPHDDELERSLRPALDGTASVLVVLTGGSSTGKTRALFEALARLAPARPLWRPAHTADLMGLLEADGPGLGPGGVLWLNEAQRFFYGGRAEEAAAALRRLLLTRTGIIAAGTLWTEPYWEELVRPAVAGDPHSQVRALLQSPVTRRIAVPGELTDAESGRWEELARSTGDTRMADAVRAGAADGKVVQHLSGGPELLDAYLMGPGGHFTHAEHALVTAAVVARELGHRTAIPRALLAEAADAALAPRLRPADADWARAALDALTAGVRPDGRRTDIRHTLTALVAVRSAAGTEPAYEPADYLHQALRARRAVPQASPALWEALTRHTRDPDGLNLLSLAAQNRDFVKQAVLLLRRATVAGHPRAGLSLFFVAPGAAYDDQDVARWIAEHAVLDAPRYAAECFREVREYGDDGAAARLAERAAAALDVTDSDELCEVLDLFLEAGLTASAAALADRALPGADPGCPDFARLLLRIRRATGHPPAELADWARELAGRVRTAEPLVVMLLVEELREADQGGAAAALADRVVASADVDAPGAVAELMRSVRAAGMTSAARHLAVRAVPAVELTDPAEVGALLDQLAAAGLADGVRDLLARDPVEQAVAGRAHGVVLLLWALRRLGQDGPAGRLIDRTAAELDLTDPGYAAYLIEQLPLLGRQALVPELAGRAARETFVREVSGLGFLLRTLRSLGRTDEVAELSRRAVDAARPGWTVDTNISMPGSSNLEPDVAGLLLLLREVGHDDLAERLIDKASRSDVLARCGPDSVDRLLRSLREAGESAAADRVARAAPAPAPEHQDADPPHRRSPYGLETDGSPARPWTWQDLDAPRTVPAPRRHLGGGDRPPIEAGPWSGWDRYHDN
ncbi:hypothetical protein [Streptomyces sp. NPDC090022]|uniref:hypothetical protein n=1 Tax=Streptomyces sp. NPDC090022 TaxID=3365920 RepID=UPI003817A93D